jgi:hypothetical protein
MGTIEGLLTGCASPVRERNNKKAIFLAGKSRRLLQNAHLLRCTSNLTARRINYTPRDSVLVRLASEHFSPMKNNFQ